MKRHSLMKKIRKAAKAAGVDYTEYEMTRHSGITVGEVSTAVPRHSEISEQMAEVIFKQLEDALGKGWWRQ